MNRPLGRCPTCGHGLDDDTRKHMGLRNGEVLNSLCPGNIGPSDIDHVLHNGRHVPEERIVFFEYKNGVPVPGGQKWLLNSLKGNWTSDDDRKLSIKYQVLHQYEPHPESALSRAVEWVFDKR